jgi:hypothetical protein
LLGRWRLPVGGYRLEYVTTIIEYLQVNGTDSSWFLIDSYVTMLESTPFDEGS